MVDPLDIRHENKILLFLLERGEIKKTDLLKIMSSSDSLSRSLQDLINAGLIESETKVAGRRIILIRLTSIGKEVSELLRKAQELLKNSIKNQGIGLKICNLCGRENSEEAKYCNQCGVKLE